MECEYMKENHHQPIKKRATTFQMETFLEIEFFIWNWRFLLPHLIYSCAINCIAFWHLQNDMQTHKTWLWLNRDFVCSVLICFAFSCKWTLMILFFQFKCIESKAILKWTMCFFDVLFRSLLHFSCSALLLQFRRMLLMFNADELIAF